MFSARFITPPHPPETVERRLAIASEWTETFIE
jgi:hypothetical protein